MAIAASRSRQRRGRHGLSLLEVILALTILGMSMVVVGQLVRLGAQNALRARDLMNAQFLAESKMEELRAKILQLQSVGPVPFEQYENPNMEEQWVYTVLVEPLPETGMMAVGVMVERQDSGRPVQYSLMSWMIDTDLEQELEDAEAAADEAAAAAEAAAADSGGAGGAGNG